MSDETPFLRLNREHFNVVELGADDDRDYWLSRSIEERLAYTEYLRQMNHADYAERRLQRVFEVAERPRD